MDVPVVLAIIILLYVMQRRFWLERLSAANRYQLYKVGGDYLDLLFIIHLLLTIVYYTYAIIKFSDSLQYYSDSSLSESWLNLWGTDSKFINFISWPLTHWIGLSYEGTTILFTYIGFQGVILFYLVAKENIFALKPITGSLSIVEYVFMLPNLHFWTSSIGKGSVITTGIALVVYGLSRYQSRKIHIALGAFIIYILRPHILFAILLGIGLGMIFSRRGVKLSVKFTLIALAAVLMFFITDDLYKYVGQDNLNIFQSDAIVKRGKDLGKSARSGIDISNYNQIEKIFTFWYRPLFIDAPGILGIIVSFENFLYLLFTLNLFRIGLVSWRYWNGWFRMLLFSFLFGSIALAQVTGNMGIAMRQKAQLMPMFFILYCRVMSLKGKRELPKEPI